MLSNLKSCESRYRDPRFYAQSFTLFASCCWTAWWILAVKQLGTGIQTPVQPASAITKRCSLFFSGTSDCHWSASSAIIVMDTLVCVVKRESMTVSWTARHPQPPTLPHAKPLWKSWARYVLLKKGSSQLTLKAFHPQRTRPALFVHIHPLRYCKASPSSFAVLSPKAVLLYRTWAELYMSMLIEPAMGTRLFYTSRRRETRTTYIKLPATTSTTYMTRRSTFAQRYVSFYPTSITSQADTISEVWMGEE